MIEDYAVEAKLVMEGDILPLCVEGYPGIHDDLFCVTGYSWGVSGLVFSGYSLLSGESTSLPPVRPSQPIVIFERV